MVFVETAFAWCRCPAPVKAAVPGSEAQRPTPVCRSGIFKGGQPLNRSLVPFWRTRKEPPAGEANESGPARKQYPGTGLAQQSPAGQAKELGVAGKRTLGTGLAQ